MADHYGDAEIVFVSDPPLFLNHLPTIYPPIYPSRWMFEKNEKK